MQVTADIEQDLAPAQLRTGDQRVIAGEEREPLARPQIRIDLACRRAGLVAPGVIRAEREPQALTTGYRPAEIKPERGRGGGNGAGSAIASQAPIRWQDPRPA